MFNKPFTKAYSEMSEDEKEFVNHQEFLRRNKQYNEIYLFCELCQIIDELNQLKKK